MKISNDMLNILGCPHHLNAGLIEVEAGLQCNECGEIYKIRNLKGQFIPDFLLINEAENWRRGFRPLQSGLIGKFQGSSTDKPIDKKMEVILDLGCGNNARGTYNVDCYVPDEIPRNFILANVENLPIRSKSVDVVVSYYNLEHLVAPAQHIKAITTIAKKKVEIITDNSDWIGDIVFRLIGSGRIFHDEHYYKWSSEYFYNLLFRLGFSSYTVNVKNLSKSRVVTLVSQLGRIPRIGTLFYRDLHAVIFIQK